MDSFTSLDALYPSSPSTSDVALESLSVSPSSHDGQQPHSELPVDSEAGGGDLVAWCVIA
ncbi:hypothetical protein GYMLUDRAFT_97988 [Collybiopsis luxurians FD-317 M1]|uniref:Unplaced genomic scaffold GYMLUscaffold_35, whole genome shotgun sequence n=1 Tax=Collybiopsis luxurians FD-317 M1 TaxID=944289 RepID=A0A0D0CST1_9AGAR|nr:hypothetical protein GYMLUDRAFT_97988 [Collybiopsis luxurians FD-317 M1]